MKHDTFKASFFIIVLVGALYLLYMVYTPFLSAIFLAAVTVIVFYPVNRFFRSLFNDKKSLSALVSTIVTVLVICVPLFFLSGIVLNQAYSGYVSITQHGGEAFNSLGDFVGKVDSFVNRFVPPEFFNLDSYLNPKILVAKGLSFLATNIDSLFSGVFKGVLNIFIFVLGVFYLFRDGNQLKEVLIKISPLNDKYDSEIGFTLGKAINSVIKGYLVVALIQGLVAGIGYTVFGVPTPAVWGFVAGLAALVPTLGTSLVNGPAVAYLMLTGHIWTGVGLLLWAVLVVGLIDNFLGPMFINRGIKIHQFLILLAVLGGLAFFGPIGFIAGPVLLSLVFALVHLYPTIIIQKQITKKTTAK